MGFRKTPHILRKKSHVRRLQCDVRPGGAHSDTHIGASQGRCVIDAIADEGDLAAGSQFASHPDLVLRKHVGVDFLGPQAKLFAYARAPSLEKVIAAGADFIVRSGWRTIRIVIMDGHPVDWNAVYAPMRIGQVREIDVFIEHSGHKQKGRGKPLFQARLIIKRKDAEAAERSLKSAISRHQRRRSSQVMLPTTVAATGFVMLLTSIPAADMTAKAVLDVYRLRWQIELGFKRLKSGLGIHKLPARDVRLARTWLTAHLILALMIEEAVTDVLDSPPCDDETVVNQAHVAVAAA